MKLKTESDGRMFPITDSSSTIIECLLSEARKLGVEIRLRQRVERIEKGFTIHLKDNPSLTCKHLILATGSSPEGYANAESLGHTIAAPVPSLFTFNVPTSPLKELSGISVDLATVEVGPFTQTGPLLITHFGFSGPAILKLSAWGARFLHEKNYRTPFSINWVPKLSQEDLFQKLLQLKEQSPKRRSLPSIRFIFLKTSGKNSSA